MRPRIRFRIDRIAVARACAAAVTLAVTAISTRAGAAIPPPVTDAYTGHPRLLFRAAEISGLRARVRDEATPRRVYAGILSDARASLAAPVDTLLDFLSGGPRIAELGLAGRIESRDPGFLKLARQMTQEIARRWDVDDDDFASALRLRALAIGYDVAFNNTPTADRDEVRAEILSYLAYMPGRFNYFRYRHRPYASNRGATVGAAMGLAVLSLRGDVPPSSEALLPAALAFADEILLADLEALLPADGSYREGVLYAAWAMRMALPYIEARRSIDGVDLANAPSFARLASWLCYELLPEGRGRTNNLNDSLWKTSPLAMHTTLLDWSQARHSSRLAKYLEEHITVPYGFDYGPRTDRVSTVVWNRPLAPVDPASVLPAGRLFADRGLYAYRSGWKSGATGQEVLFTFFAGPFQGGHAQEDQGSFTLYAYGDRYALDCGNASPGPGPKESESHNVVLVDNRGQHNAGNSIGTDARITTAILSPFADYVAADLSSAYRTYSPLNAPDVPFPGTDWSWGYDGGSAVARAARSVLVLKGAHPPLFVVNDDIAKDAAQSYDWQLHTDLNLVAIDGTSNPLLLTGGTSAMQVLLVNAEPKPAVTAAAYSHGGEDPGTRRLLWHVAGPEAALTAAFVPHPAGTVAPELRADREGRATFLAIRREATTDLVLIAPQTPAPRDRFALNSDAALATVRVEGSTAVDGYLMAAGTTLAIGDKWIAWTGVPTNCALASDTLVLGDGGAAFLAFGPRVQAVRGPDGPVQFVRDGEYVRSPSMAQNSLPPGAGASTWRRIDGTGGLGTVAAVMEPALGPPSANPFRDRVAFRLGASARPVAVEVFDLRGRLVRRLVAPRIVERGTDITWDARDDAGANVAAGLYLVRCRRGTETLTRKILLSR